MKQSRKYPITWFSNCLLFICIKMTFDLAKFVATQHIFMHLCAFRASASYCPSVSFLWGTGILLCTPSKKVLWRARVLLTLFNESKVWVPCALLGAALYLSQKHCCANAHISLEHIQGVSIFKLSSLCSKFLLYLLKMLCTNWLSKNDVFMNAGMPHSTGTEQYF